MFWPAVAGRPTSLIVCHVRAFTPIHHVYYVYDVCVQMV